MILCDFFLPIAMTRRFSYILSILTCLHLAAFVKLKRCMPCADPFESFHKCFDQQQDKKIVESSGLCARGCPRPSESCSHQIGRNGSECQFYKSAGKEGCSAKAVGDWPILQCDLSKEWQCRCPPASSGHVPLEDQVVITSYPFQCDCTAANQYVAVPDITIRNSGWRELSVVAMGTGLEPDNEFCGQFRLTVDADGRPLRYDCPNYEYRRQGTALRLELCTGEHTVIYRFRLPHIDNIGYDVRNVSTWEPLIAVHTHRSDALVYSVQRSPAALNITEYDVELVYCEEVSNSNCSRSRAIQGTRRRVTELPSTSDHNPGVFRLKFDIPEEAGNISLRVKPVGGRPTFSALLDHPGKNTVQMIIFASVLTLCLVSAVAAVVWLKKFYKPKEPAEVEVLVVYNSNASLARHVARQLETHCMIKTKLDVVDIPQAITGMDPVEWLTTELERCQTVLILVFPENAAPPIYPRLYPMTIHHLHMDAGRKTVVIGHAGGAACAPLPNLPAARRCRLPAQLSTMVRAVRGAAWLGKGSLDARELARRLTESEGGRALPAMLQRPAEALPPPDVLPLPADDMTLPQPLLSLLPAQPVRDESQIAPHIPSTDTVLDPLTSNGKVRPIVDSDALDDDPDIQWS